MSDTERDALAETTPADTDAAAAARDRSLAAEKVRSFPQTPGVYLMKDAAGRVIYVGKAKNLRARAGSYFLKAAAEDRRTADLVREIRDIDYLEAESEVDALLLESRLVKDVQPRFNSDLKDDKTFPYLQITTHEDYPRVEFTRTPKRKGVKLYGPFTSAGSLRGAIVVLQRIFKFRTCTLDIDADDEQWRWFRPCLLASIDQCTAPATCGSPRRTTAATSSGSRRSSTAARSGCSPRCTRTCSRRRRSSSSSGRPGSATRSGSWKRSTSGATSRRTCSPRCSSSIPRRASPAWRRCSA
jgi:hypothetical protein